MPHKGYFNKERKGCKEGAPQFCRRRVHVKTKKRPRQSRGRAGKQWFCLTVSAHRTGKPPWRPSGLPWGLFIFCIQIGGANPLCAAGQNDLPAAAGEVLRPARCKWNILLRKTAPASGGNCLPAASGAYCFAKLQNAPLPKNIDAAAHANYPFGRRGGFSPGPGWGRGDNFLLSGSFCFYIASTSAFVSRAIISSSLVHTTSTFTRLPSPVMSLMSSPRSLFFSASIEMPRNSISLHTSLRT